MNTEEERLLKAIFENSEDDNDSNYPETYSEKVGYAECVVTQILPNISRVIWRLSRLDRLLTVSEKDGKNTLPDIITNNELRMALEPLLQVENDISEITGMLTEIYKDTKPQKGKGAEADAALAAQKGAKE